MYWVSLALAPAEPPPEPEEPEEVACGELAALVVEAAGVEASAVEADAAEDAALALDGAEAGEFKAVRPEFPDEIALMDMSCSLL